MPDYAVWLGQFQQTVVAVINTAGPSLFAVLAIIGGFYFVWGRVRSLW